LTAIQGLAQTPAADAPEVSSHEAGITFSSRVNMVSVPVVVRDAQGQAVGSLKQDDFQLFDKGKLQSITKFTLEKSGAGAVDVETSATNPTGGIQTRPAPAKPVLPERYVAYVIDDIHLLRGDLMQARVAVNRHLDEALEANSRAAIFTTSGRMMADFTDDREKLRKAVNSILPWSSGSDPSQDCPPVSYYMADLLANKLLYFSGFLFTDEQLAAMVAAGQADQALMAVLSEAATCVSAPPGQSGAVMMIRELRRAIHQSLTYGAQETSFSLSTLMDIIRRMSSMPGTRTIVLASPGFLLTVDHRYAEYDVLDRALHANVTINTIDMRGLYTMPGSDASQKGAQSSAGGYLTQAEISAASQQDDVLGELADGTGGIFFHNDNGLKEGLNRLAARPEYIYVLGFSPQDLKNDGSYHELKVKIRNSRNMTLQVRKGYWAPMHAATAADEAKDEIREAVFSREEIQDIPVDVETEFFRLTDEKTELTVTGHLDIGALHFQRADDRNKDTVTIVSGLFDGDGNYVSGIRRVVELRLRDQSMKTLEASGIRIKEVFNVAPGRYIVRMVVWDGEGHTMAARNRGVEIP
jgi:VWFA-related protein